MYLIYNPAQTAKAPYEAKIQLLFNFFKDRQDNGIKFIDFTKMVPIPTTQLYNYSRDELKEILMEDKCTLGGLNPALSQLKTDQNSKDKHTLMVSSSGNNSPLSNHNSLYSLPLQSLSTSTVSLKKETIIELDYEPPKL